jgi:hypothetical protein
MKNYVGRKIRGFRFEDIKDVAAFASSMEKCIGKVGEIISETRETVMVRFRYDSWSYPISLIEPHLIEECTCENTGDITCNYCEEIQDKAILKDAKSKMQTPVIPQLGEGVLMRVSDDDVHWGDYNIIARLANGRFIDSEGNIWKLARPIPQLPKYTHAELVEKLGEDFEIIK